MLDWLLQNTFMPHGHCYLWRPDILWMHVLSDATIALAYFSIPVTLLYFLRKRPDLPFPAIVVLFAAFIVLCGISHILEIWTVWRPNYTLQGVEKAATALVSIATAIAMIPLVPKVLAMRTPEQSQRMVDDAVGQLQQAQAQLVQNEKLASLGSAVAGVTHEVSTPIGIGVTAASTLQEMAQNIERSFQAGTMKKSELQQFLTDARASSDILLKNLKRASDLMSSFKQVAVDQASGELRQNHLREYSAEVLVSLTPLLKRSDAVVDVQFVQDVALLTQPGAIAQIISNLVGYSLIHAFPEGRKGKIAIAVEAQGKDVVLQYRDDGVGIAKEHLERIFTTKRGSGGSGLGMHIVQNLVVKTLGGSIDVNSAPDTGIDVLIRFPNAAA